MATLILCGAYAVGWVVLLVLMDHLEGPETAARGRDLDNWN